MSKQTNKIFPKIGAITLIIILIAASTSASIPVNVNKKIRDKNIFSEDTIVQENLDDSIGFDLYNNFKKIVGNDSKIHFCGPAKINSTGKGLHLGFFLKLLILELPFTLVNPYPFSLPRRLWNQWIILADYYNDENASTTIEPLNKDESILLDGNHTVLAAIYKFSVPINLRNLINVIVNILFNKTIDFPLYKFRGSMFWYWKLTGHRTIEYIVYVSLIMAWFTFWPFKIKTQFLGFIEQVNWYGYTPFVIWTDSSVINNIFKRN